MKFLKKVIKNALREFVEEGGIEVVKRAVEHIVLDTENVNILTVDCSSMPNGKAMEFLEKVRIMIKEQNPDLKVVLLAKRT